MKRHFLSKRESGEFLDIMQKYGIQVDTKNLEIEENDVSIIYAEKKPILLKYQDQWLPTAKAMLDRGFPYVIVDDGAANSIKNGAKLYAVGITNISGNLEIEKTCIIADKNGKVLGSGLVKSDPKEIQDKKKGAYILVYERI